MSTRKIYPIALDSTDSDCMSLALSYGRLANTTGFIGKKAYKDIINDRDALFIVDATEETIKVFFSYNTALFTFKHNLEDETLTTLSYNTTTSAWELEINTFSIKDYGNVDWVGFNNTVLSWRGVNSRYFNIDTSIGITGYTLIDEELSSGEIVYTPFTPFIYKEGDVYGQLPSIGSTSHKVLGCAHLLDNQSSIIAITATNYKDETNPDKTFGGHYTECWLTFDRVKWERLSAVATGRATSNWFFNQSGTVASTVTDTPNKQVFTFSITADINNKNKYYATFRSKPACTSTITLNNSSTEDPRNRLLGPALGEYKDPSQYTVQDGEKVEITSTKTANTVRETISCIEAIDYKNDSPLELRSITNKEDTNTYITNDFFKVGWLREYPYNSPDDFVLEFEKVCVSVGDAPNIGGGCAPYTIITSGPVTADEHGRILTVTPTAGASAKVVWLATDSVGRTATKTVNIRGGIWTNPVDTIFGTNIGPCTFVDCFCANHHYLSGSDFFNGKSIFISDNKCTTEAVNLSGIVAYAPSDSSSTCDATSFDSCTLSSNCWQYGYTQGEWRFP